MTSRVRAILALGRVGMMGMACGGQTVYDVPLGGTGGDTGAPIGVELAGTGGQLPTDGATSAADPMPVGSDLVDVTGEDLKLPPGCIGTGIEWDPAVPAIQLVVDLSVTMLESAPGDTVTSWEITRDSLRSALDALSVSASLRVSFFPNMAPPPNPTTHMPSTTCLNQADDVVEFQQSTGHDAIDTALGAVSPQLAGAPIHDAYRTAWTSLEAPPGRIPVVLLVTNGFSNYWLGCEGTGLIDDKEIDPAPIVLEVEAARAAGVLTLVVGAPGSASNPFGGRDARPWLSSAATRGGMARAGCSESGPNYCHLDMTEQRDISTALNEVLESFASGGLPGCTMTMPPGYAAVPNLLSVTLMDLGGRTYVVRHNDFEPCSRGWHAIEGGTKIELCSETCQTAKGLLGGQLSVQIACEGGQTK